MENDDCRFDSRIPPDSVECFVGEYEGIAACLSEGMSEHFFHFIL